MIENDLFLRACRRQPVDRLPVWYMRQAGRYQPEYRRIKERYSLVGICEQPELCAQVTMLPVQQLGVDAAILFSDIMIPVGAMGVPFDIEADRGPVIHRPVRTQDDVRRLAEVDPESDLPHVLETIRLLRDQLTIPLIGFAGGPFTLASYMIEGAPSREHLLTKGMMYRDPQTWRQLMDRLASMIVAYMRAQVHAGASAIQIFDSWVGCLSPEDFRDYVLPTMQTIFAGLKDLRVPLIYFGVTTADLLPMWRETGADVIGIDWRTPVHTARARVGNDVALQGNLDPAVLLGPWPEVERRARVIVDAGIQQPGFIFNLGHGVLKMVEVDQLQRLTRFVHEYSEQKLAERREGKSS